MGYHQRTISKGRLGALSKIREELDEAEDAETRSRILLLCELADLIGAVQAYLTAQFGETVTLQDLEAMAILTAEAFKEGKR